MHTSTPLHIPSAPRAQDSLRLGGTDFPYELVLENTIVGVGYMLERRFLWANARMAQIFGYEPGELDGEPVRKLYSTQRDYEEVGGRFARFARNNSYTHERALVRKNGELIWCLISGRMIEPNRPDSPSVWVVQDISDRKRAEDQLRRANQRLEQTVARRTLNLRRTNDALHVEVERRREAQLSSAQSREKYRALFRHMPLGVLVADADGSITEVNRALQTWLGAVNRRALDALLTDASRVITETGDTKSVASIVRQHVGDTARRVGRFEIGWLTAAGTRREISVIAAPLSGSRQGVVFAFADVTEQRRAREREHAQQAALTHASRLSLMGQMASALAHELGQPLNACQSYLTGLQHRLGDELADRPELGQALAKASAHLEQAGQIIRNVRGFVGRQKPGFEAADLRTLLDQTLTLLDLPLRAGGVQATVHVEGAETPLPKVRCHPVEIQQVLFNLLINAIESMQDLAPPQRRIDIRLAVEARSLVSVRVSDRGSGVAPDVAQRIFEPYVTTKASGLGMGLMISRTIVESHGGSLRLVPSSGGGACFLFTLRAVRASA